MIIPSSSFDGQVLYWTYAPQIYPNTLAVGDYTLVFISRFIGGPDKWKRHPSSSVEQCGL